MGMIQRSREKLSKDGFISLVTDGAIYIYNEHVSEFGSVNKSKLAINGGIGNILSFYNPQSFVEIGVGNGDTLESYMSNCTPLQDEYLHYHGFDTFDAGMPSNEGGAVNENPELSPSDSKMHNTPMDEVKKLKHDHDTPCEIQLHKGNTRETLTNVKSQLEDIELVYIDGGHSYDTVRSDYEKIRPCVSDGGTIVFDDLNCEDGVTRFVGELLQHEGERFEENQNNKFKKVTITPPTLSSNECAYVIIEL
jgi:hypothetical protein